MKQKLFRGNIWAMIIALAVVGLIALGCGSDSKGKLLTDVSGVWKRAQGPGTVQIDLTGKTKTLVVDGKSFPATIDKVNMDRLEVDLKVQNGAPQPETWSVRQVWDDTGEHYKLVFSRNGQKEDLSQKVG